MSSSTACAYVATHILYISTALAFGPNALTQRWDRVRLHPIEWGLYPLVITASVSLTLTCRRADLRQPGPSRIQLHELLRSGLEVANISDLAEAIPASGGEGLGSEIDGQAELPVVDARAADMVAVIV